LKKLEDYTIPKLFPSSPVGDPQVSPDGGRVLFTYTTLDMEEDKYHTHIWLHDGKKPRQFTYGVSSESNPRWSPNGKEILFVTVRDPPKGEGKDMKPPKPQIYIIPAYGGEARKLTDEEEGAMQPEWLPDGKKILFRSSVFKGEKMEDSDVKIIDRLPYRMDGRGYLGGNRTHLFVIPSKGGKVKQITDGDYDIKGTSISPDSKTIAFTSNLDPDAELSRHTHIYKVSVKGGDPEKLLNWKGSIGSIAYSPDGKYIAFTGKKIDDPSLDWYRNSELWIMPSEGGEPKCLTGEFDRSVGGFSGFKWSHDGASVILTAPNHGTSNLLRVTLEGEIVWLTEEQWSIGAYSIDRKGKKIVFLASDAVTPYEIYVLKNHLPVKITEMNKGLLKKLTINPPEEFWFTASDGGKVHGWLIKPHGFEEGKKYPAAVEIHGGPHGSYGLKFGAAEHEFQTIASYGMVVVYTNPRGSTSYGEEHTRAVCGAWGERDYLDIMEAVDYAVKKFKFIDKNRLGVLGGSYGGYLTNWIVGQTDRFKAAVTQRSISNWHSMMGTSDIGWRDHEVSYGKHPWEYADEILKHSPITYLGNVKTPLLVIHSENDFRCPIEQGEQMYVGLKAQGKPTMMVRFPNESHGLGGKGKPKHRLERLRHIVRWLDYHLNE